MSAESRTSAWVATLTGGQLVGPGAVPVAGVGSLDEAGPSAVSFLAQPRYRDRVLPSKAGVVLVPLDFAPPPPAGRAWVRCADPSAAFSAVVTAFAPPPVVYAPGRDKTAVVAASATVPDSVHVGPGAVIEADACIGERTVIGAGCYVGHATRIGADCLLYPRVVIRERCLLGQRVIVHSGAVIGADGFGYTSGAAGHTKIPQVGIVQLDDDVEIGALTAVDRARFGRTWIQRGSKIDNLVQVAHNVVIGQHCLVAGQAGISGSTHLGNGVVLAGQVGLAGHLTIGDGAVMMAQAGSGSDVPPKAFMIGSPAVDRREYARHQMNIKRIDRMSRTLKELEAQVQALRQRLEGAG
jgi:UDP-3-O-[3-hydroxymyristoyl] glucosamine N-acyltransferase